MSRNEDYLDDLLNSVSDANRRNNKKNIEDLIESMNQETKKPKEKSVRQPLQKRDFGEKFVREFEQEIAMGAADDFLHDFELELEADAAQEQGDIDINSSEEQEEYISQVSDIVDGAKRKLEEGEDQDEETVTQSELSEGEELLQEEEQTEETVDAETSEADEDVSDVTDGEDTDGEQLLDESGDLMDMLSEDDSLSDIGDMLKADEEGTPLESEEETLSEDGSLGFSEGEENEETEEPQDEFDRLGSIDELRALSEGKKGKKKKNGFFARLMRALFGEDEEEDAVVVKEQDSLGNISDENLGIMQELDAAEQKSEGKDKKKKKAKKEKKEKPKKEKPKKEKPKKEKKPKEKDTSPPLPKKPVILIFVMAISILILILLGSSNIQYSQDISYAKDCYDQGDYTMAYQTLSGSKLKGKDNTLYQKAAILANIQQEYEAYETMYSLGEYEMALDSLVRGVVRCNNFMEKASEYQATAELTTMKEKLVQTLSEQFGVSEEKAIELCAIRKRKDYTKAIQEILKNLGLNEETI